MTSLLQKISSLDIKVDGLDSSTLQTQIDTNTNDISGIQTNKQDKLTAGDNITITGNTISSSGGGSGTTIDSTTDLSCNTLDTLGDVNIGGVMIAPKQPCFRAYPSQNVTINGASLSDGTTTLTYNLIDIDNTNSYNTTTKEYTVPVAGNWFFYWSSGVVNGRRVSTSIRKNNIVVEICLLQSSLAVRTNDTVGAKGHSIISCAVGDVLRITCNGGLQSASLTSQNNFGGFLIG